MRALVAVMLFSGLAQAQIKGWYVDPVADYEAGLDRQVTHGGHASAYLRSLGPAPKEAAIKQVLDAEHYRGKRVRLSAWLKSDSAEAAALVLRVEPPDNRVAMAYGRSELKGTIGWERREIVLEVDPTATRITLGVGLWKSGRVWIDDVSLTVVDKSVPTNDLLPHWPSQPANLGFEE